MSSLDKVSEMLRQKQRFLEHVKKEGKGKQRDEQLAELLAQGEIGIDFFRFEMTIGKFLRNEVKLLTFIEKGFTERHMIDLLLLRSHGAQETFVLEMVMQIEKKFKAYDHKKQKLYLDKDELYFAAHPSGNLEKGQFFLGSDLVDPCIEVPSQEELKASYLWHQKTRTDDSAIFCRTFYDWERHNLLEVFRKVAAYATASTISLVRWSSVYKREKEGDDLLHYFYSIYMRYAKHLLEEMGNLRETGAPAFMIEECEEHSERVGRILQKLYTAKFDKKPKKA